MLDNAIHVQAFLKSGNSLLSDYYNFAAGGKKYLET